MPWVGLQCVIVVFPDHTRSILSLCFDNNKTYGEDFANIHVINLSAPSPKWLRLAVVLLLIIHCALFPVRVVFGSCFVMQY